MICGGSALQFTFRSDCEASLLLYFLHMSCRRRSVFKIPDQDWIKIRKEESETATLITAPVSILVPILPHPTSVSISSNYAICYPFITTLSLSLYLSLPILFISSLIPLMDSSLDLRSLSLAYSTTSLASSTCLMSNLFLYLSLPLSLSTPLSL